MSTRYSKNGIKKAQISLFIHFVLHLAAHRGLAVFKVTFPVNRVVADLGETAGAAVNAEVNL